MPRFSSHWCKLKREILSISTGDSLILGLYSLLCIWASPSDETEGRIKLKYSQILTSDEELARILGSDKKAIERRIRKLKDNGFVLLERDRQYGRIITVLLPKNEKNVSHRPVHEVSHRLNLESHDAQGFQDNIAEKVSHEVSHRASILKRIENLEKEKEGGDARAHADKEALASPKKTLPLFSPSAHGSGTGIAKLVALPSPELRKGPPDEEESLAKDWYGRTQEFAKIRGFAFEDISDQLEHLRERGYTTQQLRQILIYIKTANIGKKFIAPIDAFKDHFGNPVIEVAYAELKNTPEGKREEAKQSKAHVEAKMKNQSLRERLAAEVLLKAKESKE